jgi:hypothetical protein
MTTDDPAIRELEDRLFQIYHRAGREVTYVTASGDRRKYWPKRYLQALRRAVDEGDDALIAFVGRLVTTNAPSRGFGYLFDQDRLDLTVEAVVADERPPYHRLFDSDVVDAARRRLAEHSYEFAAQGEDARLTTAAGPRSAHFELTVDVDADGMVTLTRHGEPPRSGTELDAIRFFMDDLATVRRTD